MNKLELNNIKEYSGMGDNIKKSLSFTWCIISVRVSALLTNHFMARIG